MIVRMSDGVVLDFNKMINGLDGGPLLGYMLSYGKDVMIGEISLDTAVTLQDTLRKLRHDVDKATTIPLYASCRKCLIEVIDLWLEGLELSLYGITLNPSENSVLQNLLSQE